MDLYEHQGKELFRDHGIPTPRGIVARSGDEARRAAEELGGGAVVKVQVQTGGRGKGGGGGAVPVVVTQVVQKDVPVQIQVVGNVEASDVYRYAPWFAWLTVPFTYLPIWLAGAIWSLMLEPRLARHIVDTLSKHIQKLLADGHPPLVLCAPQIRLAFRRFFETTFADLAVLSYAEVPARVEIQSAAMVGSPD